MIADHQFLSDAELRARLSQRQVPTADARWLVDHRDDPGVDDRITEILEGSS